MAVSSNKRWSDSVVMWFTRLVVVWEWESNLVVKASVALMRVLRWALCCWVAVLVAEIS